MLLLLFSGSGSAVAITPTTETYEATYQATATYAAAFETRETYEATYQVTKTYEAEWGD